MISQALLLISLRMISAALSIAVLLKTNLPISSTSFSPSTASIGNCSLVFISITTRIPFTTGVNIPATSVLSSDHCSNEVVLPLCTIPVNIHTGFTSFECTAFTNIFLIVFTSLLRPNEVGDISLASFQLCATSCIVEGSNCSTRCTSYLDLSFRFCNQECNAFFSKGESKKNHVSIMINDRTSICNEICEGINGVPTSKTDC